MSGRNLVIKTRSTDLEIRVVDIATLEIDVIVNAANAQLQLEAGTGVSGAILERGGASIQEECDRIGGSAVGTAVMTSAGELAAKQVIHAVGPQQGEGEEDRKLSSAVRSSLALAERHGFLSIALPALSTGGAGVPMERCARITLTEVQRYLQGGTKLERVVLALADDDAFEIFKRELRRGFR